VDLLVETTPVAGTEPTSALGDATDRVVDAFDRARQAIVEIAASTADVIGKAADRGAHPDHLEVEFGLKISAKGNVIVAGASGEATLRVKLTYDRSSA
jgi:hypothetical protein